VARQDREPNTNAVWTIHDQHPCIQKILYVLHSWQRGRHDC
jgi:hypothetical protein